MKFLITGAKGQLGYDLIKELERRGYKDILATDTDNMDITNKEQTIKVIKEYDPDVIFHCAAYTAVDKAEDEEQKAYQINQLGTKNIVESIKNPKTKLVYISTDYVFSGDDIGIYEPDSLPNPQNVYGKSKYAGEEEVLKYPKHFIVRISWVFGKNGKNFIRTMVNLGKTHDKLTVVSDQIGTPTYTYDLARLLVDMVETEKYGYYHATNEGGFISWYDFTKEIFRQAAALGHKEYEKVEVSPVTTAEYGVSKAVRPFNSRLDKSKLVKNGFQPLPTWQDALERYLKEIL